MSKKPDYCPDWFDVANYEPCKSYSRVSWYTVLLTRVMYLDPDRFSDIGEKSTSDIYPELDSYIEGVKLCTSLEYLEKMKNAAHEFMEAIHEPKSIYDFRMIDFVFMYDELRETKPDFIAKLHECIEKEKTLTPEELEQYSWLDEIDEELRKNEEVSFSFVAPKVGMGRAISIDLEASNDVIIEEFTEWLNEQRKASEEQKHYYKRISDTELKKYADLKVLPYLDLWLWGKRTGNELTNIQIANLLYPDDTETDIFERVRKVTAPKARRLWEYGFSLLK